MDALGSRRSWRTLPYLSLPSDLLTMSESSLYQQFFSEFKRRRVFRIAAVYGGGERDACGFRQIWDP